jgi:hypothetical protein
MSPAALLLLIGQFTADHTEESSGTVNQFTFGRRFETIFPVVRSYAETEPVIASDRF